MQKVKLAQKGSFKEYITPHLVDDVLSVADGWVREGAVGEGAGVV